MNDNWKMIRTYPDGSEVWSDGTGQLAFCDAGDAPQDQAADIAGGSTAWDWLIWADDRQSAEAPANG